MEYVHAPSTTPLPIHGIKIYAVHTHTHTQSRKLTRTLLTGYRVQKAHGYGFVKFENIDDLYTAARELNGHVVDGNTLQIKVQSRGGKPVSVPTPPKSETTLTPPAPQLPLSAPSEPPTQTHHFFRAANVASTSPRYEAPPTSVAPAASTAPQPNEEEETTSSPNEETVPAAAVGAAAEDVRIVVVAAEEDVGLPAAVAEDVSAAASAAVAVAAVEKASAASAVAVAAIKACTKRAFRKQKMDPLLTEALAAVAVKAVVSVEKVSAVSAVPVAVAAIAALTKRAMLNGNIDLLEAEAFNDLIHAETRGQQKQAMQQMAGAHKKLYKRWRTDLDVCRAQVDAYRLWRDLGINEGIEEHLDYGPDSEHTINGPTREKVRSILKEVVSHLSDGRRGESIRSGLRCNLVGPPNAGKSSLLNVLAGRAAAIVSPVPGTTRDEVQVRLDVGALLILCVRVAVCCSACCNVCYTVFCECVSMVVLFSFSLYVSPLYLCV